MVVCISVDSVLTDCRAGLGKVKTINSELNGDTLPVDLFGVIGHFT